ncbi:MAG: DUF932 domain-containing protein [Planctomycetaceae bacterium]|nr:DUF932 domain-containing protein [Planctomycetaceae bacterium]
MAHEISITTNGTAEAFFALKPAWHGLGTVLDHAPTSAEAITAAHLDWNVSKVPLQTDEGAEVPNYFATVRRDTGACLGVVTDKYSIVQNRDAFGFLDSLLQDGLIRYESAGALRGGRTVWLLARMPSVDTIAAGDDTLRYILFSTSHDGSGAIHAIPTSTRVVCANTLRIATARDIGFRHTGNVKAKLDFARQYLSQFDEKFTLFRDNARLLAERKLTPEGSREYIAKLFPEVTDDGRAKSIRERRVESVRQAFRADRQQLPSIKGTWWAMFNAVTESVDHDARGTRGGDVRTKRENKMLSTLDGQGAEFKAKAFDLALSMSS